jgi:hypothetical protein
MRQVILVLLLTASPALATSYSRPVRHDVFSHNRHFVLDVNPKTSVHTVYSVLDRTTPLWSFSCVVWHFPFLLSDDGTVVATVAWEHIWEQHVATEDAVTFWNKDGVFRTHPLRDLCPDPPRTRDVGVGPIGDFWRTWYKEVSDDGDSFAICTTRGVEYRFRFADGEMVAQRPFGWRAWRGWVLVFCGGLIFACAALLWYRRRLHLAAKARRVGGAEQSIAPDGASRHGDSHFKASETRPTGEPGRSHRIQLP